VGFIFEVSHQSPGDIIDFRFIFIPVGIIADFRRHLPFVGFYMRMAAAKNKN